MLLSSVVALVLAAQAVAEPLTDMIEKVCSGVTRALTAADKTQDAQSVRAVHRQRLAKQVVGWARAAHSRWDFGGDAIINTGKHVRLTQDRQSQSGWLWSRMPMSVANWQVDFEFKVGVGWAEVLTRRWMEARRQCTATGLRCGLRVIVPRPVLSLATRVSWR